MKSKKNPWNPSESQADRSRESGHENDILKTPEMDRKSVGDSPSPFLLFPKDFDWLTMCSQITKMCPFLWLNTYADCSSRKHYKMSFLVATRKLRHSQRPFWKTNKASIMAKNEPTGAKQPPGLKREHHFRKTCVSSSSFFVTCLFPLPQFELIA